MARAGEASLRPVPSNHVTDRQLQSTFRDVSGIETMEAVPRTRAALRGGANLSVPLSILIALSEQAPFRQANTTLSWLGLSRESTYAPTAKKLRCDTVSSSIIFVTAPRDWR